MIKALALYLRCIIATQLCRGVLLNGRSESTKLAIGSIFNGTESTIANTTSIQFNSDLTLQFDPTSGAFCPTFVGLFVRASDPDAVIYFSTSGEPDFSSSVATFDSPYIELGSVASTSLMQPAKLRNRTISIIAVSFRNGLFIKSNTQVLNYTIESDARQGSAGFFVPGIESGGYFVKVKIEEKSAQRALAQSRQDFANFSAPLGVGTYVSQITALNLQALDPELTGFSGGFTAKSSDGRFFGILVPHHNGQKFSGKVVRVDLKAMGNVSECSSKYRMESLDSKGNLNITGKRDPSDACIFVIDLATIHPNAKGFRKGFIGYPYAYLSAGRYNVPVRISMENYTILSAVAFDLSIVDPSLGGHSGGFVDGPWTCFVPFDSYAGPVGGIRSNLAGDVGHLIPYYDSRMTCMHAYAWGNYSAVSHGLPYGTSPNASLFPSSFPSLIITFDLATFDTQLRGFSAAIRVGRYAYLSPLQYSTTEYSGKLVRISLGDIDIGTTVKSLQNMTTGRGVHDIIDVIDLSQHNKHLKGFSGIFTSGTYIFLVPFRSISEPRNGQKGSGMLVRVDMNYISTPRNSRNTYVQPSSIGWKGVSYLDLTKVLRTQIPNASDIDLRGFSGGFASGAYGYLVPYYNGVFSGKVCRFDLRAVWSHPDPQKVNVQELDLTEDYYRPNVYKGYQDGFGSIWNGVD